MSLSRVCLIADDNYGLATPGTTTDLGNGIEQVTFRDTVPQSAAARYIRVRAVKP